MKRSVTVAVSERRSVTRAPWRTPFRRSPETVGAPVSRAALPGAGVVMPGGTGVLPDGPGVAVGTGVGTGVPVGGGVGVGVGVGSCGSPVTVIVPVIASWWAWQRYV